MPIAHGNFGYTQHDNLHPQNGNESERARAQEEQETLKRSYYGSISPRGGRRAIATDGRRSPGQTQTHIDAESHEEMISRIKREQRRQWLSVEPDVNSRQSSAAPSAPTRALLPAPILTSEEDVENSAHSQRLEIPGSIERPRSALHSGDFRQRQGSDRAPDTPRPYQRSPPLGWMSTSPVAPWNTPLNDHGPRPPRLQTQQLEQHTSDGLDIANRHRAASYSALSSGYVYRPPTSPLVLQSNSNDVDVTDESSTVRRGSPDTSYRRRTFSPGSLQAISPTSGRFSFYEPNRFSPPSFRREGTFPMQAHQPRRSLTSLHTLPSTGDYSTPSARARRPSASDNLLLQHAPLVGQYEESILRGRMSTLPSRPLDFVAQIGVLGKGTCKPSLRCPPHVTVPFPAVFYDYKHARDRSSPHPDRPSPYVGQIDLENNLKAHVGAGRLRREQSPSSDADSNPEDMLNDRNVPSSVLQHRRRHQRRPPRGSYRLPQQGQLQIVIKNPNKTAVKLFLVPYDLTGMESGQKTFIRQRSYSWGPIIDMPLSARKNLGTERPEAALSNADNPNERPVLRYLVHLHICSPSRGRFYLYKSIRVVFANRVPDGKEKLRVETQLPEPRFTSYKPDPAPSKTGLTQQPATSIQTPRPINPVSRAVSAGEFSQRLEDKFTLRRPPRPVIGHNEATAPFGPNLPTLDFRRLRGPDSRTESEHSPFNSRNSSLSSTRAAFGHADAMSWTAQSELRDRLSPKSNMPDDSERDVVNGQNGNGSSSSSSTPRSGREGLLALQLRDWAEQHRAPSG